MRALSRRTRTTLSRRLYLPLNLVIVLAIVLANAPVIELVIVLAIVLATAPAIELAPVQRNRAVSVLRNRRIVTLISFKQQGPQPSLPPTAGGSNS